MATTPIFRPSFGNRPDRIVGRDDIISSFATGLGSYPGSRDRAILLTGQRGMGKTALLLEMADRAKESGFLVARVTCSDTMLDTILDILQQAGMSLLESRHLPVKGFTAGDLGFSLGLTSTRWEPVRPGRRYPRDGLAHGARKRATCTSKRAF